MRVRGYSLAFVCLSVLFTLALSLSNSARPIKHVINADTHEWYKSLSVATGEIGVRERTGNNDGERVAMYLASVGLVQGNPYCYAGQYWSFTQVTTKPSIKRTGLVRAFWNEAKKIGRSVPYHIEIGDFLCWGYLTSTSGHVERVSKIGRGGWVTTIAFNVSVPGLKGKSIRDGGGVAKKYRNVRHPLGRMVMMGAVGIQHT